MKKNNIWKKKVILIGLAATLMTACQKEQNSDLNSGTKEHVYYVQDVNNIWHLGYSVNVFSCGNEDGQTKFLAVLNGVEEKKAYFKSLENPESNVIVTFGEKGQVLKIYWENEESDVTILSMENFTLTSSLSYEEIESITKELNEKMRRK